MKFVGDQIKTVDVSVLVKVCYLVLCMYISAIIVHMHHICMQADIPRLWPNQVVRVIDDMAEVMKLQVGHGEWCDEMENVRPRDDKLKFQYSLM